MRNSYFEIMLVSQFLQNADGQEAEEDLQGKAGALVDWGKQVQQCCCTCQFLFQMHLDHTGFRCAAWFFIKCDITVRFGDTVNFQIAEIEHISVHQMRWNNGR